MLFGSLISKYITTGYLIFKAEINFVYTLAMLTGLSIDDTDCRK